MIDRESLFGKVIEILRSSLDLTEVKQKLVTTIGQAYQADRCYFRFYDPKKDWIYPVDVEYLSSRSIQSLIGVEPNQEGLKFFIDEAKRQKSGFHVILADEKFAKNSPLEKYIKDVNVKADYAVPIINRQDDMMWLVLHYEKKDPKLGESDKKLLETIAYQIDIAFEQIELYNSTRGAAERERILRNIIENIRGSLDIEKISSEIVNQVGKFFNADRVTLGLFDPKTKNYITSVNAEYRSSDRIKSFVDLDFTKIRGFNEYIWKYHDAGNDIIFNDVEQYLDYRELRGTGVDDFYKEYNFKSSAAINITYKDFFLGDLVVVFENQINFSEEDIIFLKTIAAQAGVAFHQAELYSKIKNQAYKETLLRKILETIRSTLEMEKMKKTIVEIVGKSLNADRCFIVDFDRKNDKFIPINDEYLASDSIMTYKGEDSNILAPNFVEASKRGEIIITNNKETIIGGEKVFFKEEFEAQKKFDVFSMIASPIVYKDELLGVFAIHFTREHFINDEEVDLIKIISSQISIAIHQAQLYKDAQDLLQRENLLRNIVEAIRSSLDFNQTKKKIVDVIGQTVGADRCLIMEYNKKTDRFLIVNDEYLSAKALLSYKGVDLNENIPFLVQEFKKGKRLVIKDDKLIFDDVVIDVLQGNMDKIKRAIDSYQVYSALVFPLFYADEFLGDLVLHYTDKDKKFGDDEVEFLSLISNQIALAFYQSKLYEKVQLQAERERISRNIIEILRSSIDKDVIKRLFIKNIGKFFKADRVFFSEYSTDKKMYLPVENDSEYLSSSEQKSFIGFDWSSPDVSEFIKLLLERREIRICNWADYLIQNPNTSEGLKKIFKEANTKSSYNFPVMYEEQIIGYFCLEYTKMVVELSEEDIDRIRSICTQAGIGLHHAVLYEQAQECQQTKDSVLREIDESTNNILDISVLLVNNEFERPVQIEYMNNIINSCHQLLELTK